MLATRTSIVRSNQNAVMFRNTNVVFGTSTYSIFELSSQSHTYTGTLNACKKAWNRNYRNSRQYVTPNGANHRYMGQ